MTTFPNREHMNAEKAARRRAITALDIIVTESMRLRKDIERGSVRVDADDTQALSDNIRKVTGHLAELGTLHDVREWDAADQAEINAALAATSKEKP